MKNKNVIILSSLFLILLAILSIIFISYGFITNKVKGNEFAKRILFKRSSISIEFSDGSEQLTTNQDGYFVAGSIISKNFNIKNTGNDDVAFNIKLSNISNPFNRINDLSYELYSYDKLISSGIFPTEEYIIAFNQQLSKSEEAEYVLKVKYATSKENQIEDSGKVIEATLTFEETIIE